MSSPHSYEGLELALPLAPCPDVSPCTLGTNFRTPRSFYNACLALGVSTENTLKQAHIKDKNIPMVAVFLRRMHGELAKADTGRVHQPRTSTLVRAAFSSHELMYRPPAHHSLQRAQDCDRCVHFWHGWG